MTPMTKDTTKDRILDEFDAVVDQTEQLLKSVAGAGSDQAGAFRAGVEQSYAAAAERLAKLREEALGHAGAAVRATDDYVQDNPWRAVGMVAAGAAIAGLIAGLLLGRREP